MGGVAPSPRATGAQPWCGEGPGVRQFLRKLTGSCRGASDATAGRVLNRGRQSRARPPTAAGADHHCPPRSGQTGATVPRLPHSPTALCKRLKHPRGWRCRPQPPSHSSHCSCHGNHISLLVIAGNLPPCPTCARHQTDVCGTGAQHRPWLQAPRKLWTHRGTTAHTGLSVTNTDPRHDVDPANGRPRGRC